MRIKNGSPIIPFQLPSTDGTTFDSASLLGQPVLLSFFRFATCPFCNMRVNELLQHQAEFSADFRIVAVFESPLEHLRKHTAVHRAPFPILSDASMTYYKAYGIERSLAGMLKGMLFRMPTLLRGMLQGHIPFPIKGSLVTMPADFLIDRQGSSRPLTTPRTRGITCPSRP